MHSHTSFSFNHMICQMRILCLWRICFCFTIMYAGIGIRPVINTII